MESVTLVNPGWGCWRSSRDNALLKAIKLSNFHRLLLNRLVSVIGTWFGSQLRRTKSLNSDQLESTQKFKCASDLDRNRVRGLNTYAILSARIRSRDFTICPDICCHSTVTFWLLYNLWFIYSFICLLIIKSRSIHVCQPQQTDLAHSDVWFSYT